MISNEYAIYCSPWQAKLLLKSQHWHVDATFFGVPTSFYQLLVILVYEDDSDLYIPACFTLCSHKNKDLYIEVFEYLKNSILEAPPLLERMTLDFEQALKDGAHKAFPKTEFIGCKYHFIEALTKKAKKKGLMTDLLKTQSKELISGISDILESGKEKLSPYLEGKLAYHNAKLNDSSTDEGTTIMSVSSSKTL